MSQSQQGPTPQAIAAASHEYRRAQALRLQQPSLLQQERQRQRQRLQQQQQQQQQQHQRQAALQNPPQPPTHPTFSSGPPQPINTPSYSTQVQPTPRPSPSIAQTLFDGLVAVLNTHQHANITRLDQLNASIDTLASQIRDVRNEAEVQTKHVSTLFEKSNAVHKVTCHVIGGRLEKLEKVVGTSFDKDEKKMLMERLDGVSFSLGELLERVRDPEANLSQESITVRRDIGTSPIVPTYVDAHVDTKTPSNTSLEPEPCVYYERGTSPPRNSNADAAVNPRTPKSSRSTSSITRSTGVGMSETAIGHPLSVPSSSPHLDASTLNTHPFGPMPFTRTVESIGNQELRRTTSLGLAGAVTDHELGGEESDEITRGYRGISYMDEEEEEEPDPEIPRDRSNSLPAIKSLSPCFSFTSANLDTHSVYGILDDNEEMYPEFGSDLVAGSQAIEEEEDELEEDEQGLAPELEIGDRHAKVSIDTEAPDAENHESIDPAPPLPAPLRTSTPHRIPTPVNTLRPRTSTPSQTPAPSGNKAIPIASSSLSPAPAHPDTPPPPSPHNTPSMEEPLEYVDGGTSPGEFGKEQAREEEGEGGITVYTQEDCSVIPMAGAGGEGEGPSYSPVPDSEDEVQSVSALITEAFASLPELDDTIGNMSTGSSGERVERRIEREWGRDREIGRDSEKEPKRTLSSDSEISLPRSRAKGAPLPPPRLVERQPTPLLFEGVNGPVFDSPPPSGAGDVDGLPTPTFMVGANESESPALTPFVLSPLPPLLQSVSKSGAVSTSKPTSTSKHTSISKPLSAAKLNRTPKSVSKPTTQRPPSPIYISSRSLSPLSSLSSLGGGLDEDRAGENSDDSDVMIIPVKRKGDERKGGKVRKEKTPSEVRSPGTGAVVREQSKKDGASRLGLDGPVHRKKLLQLKTKPMEGGSAALTRVKRRKAENVGEPEVNVDERGLKTKMKMKMKELTPMSVQSGASTKVKKRKANDREIDMEPPLKRAKRQSRSGTGSRGGSAVTGGSGSSKARGKEEQRVISGPKKRGRPPKAKGFIWPMKTKSGEGNHEFVECTSCWRWYHCGCVGVSPTDLNSVEFECPPCHGGGANPLIAVKNAVICARPDCAEAAQPSVYFVSYILGRKTRGQTSKWLLKWDDYPVDESTWEDEDSMADPQKLIEDFHVTAREEGFRDDDPSPLILLEEAVEAGWKDRIETINA